MSTPQHLIIGGKYRHYRNKLLYEVICIATHTESNEELVIYEALYDDTLRGYGGIWAKPVSMFCETVQVGEQVVPRFLLENGEK